VWPVQIKQTPNSIGYIELIYAIQNRWLTQCEERGQGSSSAGTASVSAPAHWVIERNAEDFRVSITNAAGKDSYSISSSLAADSRQDPGSGQKESAR